jgi:hypothetical protein
MKINYDEKTNDFILTLSGDDLGPIRYALAEQVHREQAQLSYLKGMKAEKDFITSKKRDVKTFTKVSKELEKITLAWCRKKR